jgi:hypothetical protein
LRFSTDFNGTKEKKRNFAYHEERYIIHIHCVDRRGYRIFIGKMSPLFLSARRTIGTLLPFHGQHLLKTIAMRRSKSPLQKK